MCKTDVIHAWLHKVPTFVICNFLFLKFLSNMDLIKTLTFSTINMYNKSLMLVNFRIPALLFHIFIRNCWEDTAHWSIYQSKNLVLASGPQRFYIVGVK